MLEGGAETCLFVQTIIKMFETLPGQQNDVMHRLWWVMPEFETT